jgi:hypothetical protein
MNPIIMKPIVMDWRIPGIAMAALLLLGSVSATAASQ